MPHLYLVDIQFYHCPSTSLHQLNAAAATTTTTNSKVLKEACILPFNLNLNNLDLLKHFAFEPPHPMHQLSAHDMRTVNYTHKMLGVLQWNAGNQEISEFVASLPGGSIILCNGLEKSLVLQGLLPLCRVLNVNTSFGPATSLPTSKLPTCLQCPYGLHKMCALHRVYQLYQYMTNV